MERLLREMLIVVYAIYDVNASEAPLTPPSPIGMGEGVLRCRYNLSLAQLSFPSPTKWEGLG